MSYAARRRFLLVAFLAVLAMVVIFAAATHGTTFARLEFSDLARQATAIARVRCLGAESQWEKNEIWTLTHFEVMEQNKGTLSSTITLRMLGGTVGNVHSRVDGVPSFRPGEEAYLFLWAREGEPYRVLGWSQGAFRISRNVQTGAERVSQDTAGVSTYQPQSRQFVRDGIREMSVADFKLRIKMALASESN